MGYIKLAYRPILQQLDYNSSLPDGWDKFVNKQKKYHNLIIKSSKNKCHCTGCNYSFISKKRVNQEVRCPICHEKYLIKRSNLRHYEFNDYLSILDKVNNTFVIRYFELKTIIDALHIPHSSIVEFAREFPNESPYRDIYVNDRVSKCQGCIHIYHDTNGFINPKKWRQYTRNYSIIDRSIVFPNNLKKLFKNTEYKYSCIWDIAKHSTYINLLKLLNNKKAIPKVELLSKMKLYNLALRAEEFYYNGSFESTFGVSKDFYPFMKKINITYKQLKILRLLKEKDLEKIKYLERYLIYTEDTTNLQEVSRYISLSRFIKYSKLHNDHVQMYLYKDYLRFAKFLGLDLKNNKYAFPKDLKAEHDKLQAQYKIHNKEFIKKEIVKRGKILSINAYKTKKFMITPAPTFEALLDESEQQHNCVRTYAENYANGSCDIYFMRNINKPDKSLVTVEVNDNAVVQSRKKFNKSPTNEQKKFLEKWEQKILKGAA